MFGQLKQRKQLIDLRWIFEVIIKLFGWTVRKQNEQIKDVRCQVSPVCELLLSW